MISAGEARIVTSAGEARGRATTGLALRSGFTPDRPDCATWAFLTSSCLVSESSPPMELESELPPVLLDFLGS